MDQWAGRFPEYYKANDDWDLVVDDVVMLERLESTTEGPSSASATSPRAND